MDELAAEEMPPDTARDGAAEEDRAKACADEPGTAPLPTRLLAGLLGVRLPRRRVQIAVWSAGRPFRRRYWMPALSLDRVI